MCNFMFQGISKVNVNNSDIIERSQVEQDKQHDIKELDNYKKM